MCGWMKKRDRLQRMLRLAVAALVTLVVVGTPVTRYVMTVHEGRSMSWAQALVFVLETITTVGYGGYSPFETIWMNLLSSFLIVVGFILVFFIVATLVARWVEERVSPRPSRETDLEDHLVLSDFNEMVEEFADALDVIGVPYLVVVEDEAEALRLEEEDEREVVMGEADDPDALLRANVVEARGVVACGPDPENLSVTLAARSLGDLPVVALVERRANMRYQELAGADSVISPKQAMGRALVDWTLAIPTPADWPPPIRVEEGANVLEGLNPSIFYITEGSPLSEMTVSEIGDLTEALVVGMWRGDQLSLNPDPEEAIRGAAIIAVGSEEDVEELAELASEGGRIDDVVITGYGDVGAEAYERLRNAGVEPVVVDLEEKDLPNQVVGDATVADTLERAGVGAADSIILTMDDDNSNMQAALEAHFLNPGIPVSAGVRRGRAMPKFQWAGVDHALSLPTVSARMLMQALVRLKLVEPPFADVATRRPVGELAGEELRAGEIRSRTGCLVIAVVRGDGEEVTPAHGGEVLREGDELVLIGRDPDLERFDDLFR